MTNLLVFKSPRYRLSKLFFYLLLVILPLGTRKAFFTDASFYHGYHAFYNTIYLYLTDLIIFGIIIAWLWEKVWMFSCENMGPLSAGPRLRAVAKTIINKVSSDSLYLFAIAFWLILAISLIFSRENLLGPSSLVKLTEFMLLFAYIREELDFSREKIRDQDRSTLPRSTVFPDRKIVFWLILATISFQALIGIVQYIGQSSLEWQIIGEEFLRPGLKGIAEFKTRGVINPILYNFFPYLSPISDSTVNLRAYGTLPHPNVLAGVLFFGLMVNLAAVYSVNKETKGFHVKTLVLGLCLVLMTTGLVVTFSRLAWAVSSAGIILWFVFIFRKLRQTRFPRTGQGAYFPGKLLFISLVLLFSLSLNFFLFGRPIRDRLFGEEMRSLAREESFMNRQIFNRLALEMIKKRPIFGVGLKNFVVETDRYTKEKLLPHLHQPVHNIYLLLAAESGVFALLVLLLFLFNIVRRAWKNLSFEIESVIHYSLILILFGWLFVGLFDHYLLTIQQGSLVFWITLGFLANKKWLATSESRE